MTRLSGGKQEQQAHQLVVRDVLAGNDSGVVCDAALSDARLFTRLLLKGSDQVPGADTPARRSSKKVNGVEELMGALMSRLPVAAQGTLQLLLYTPRFGRINVSLKHERNTYDITLTAEDAAAARRLRKVQKRCSEALEHALEQTVTLRVNEAAGS